MNTMRLRVSLAALLLTAVVTGPARAQEPGATDLRYRVTAGLLEAEVTPQGLDVLWYRDTWLLGDSHSDPRPAVAGVVLTEGWKTLAGTVGSRCEAPQVSVEDGAARFVLTGETEEAGGPGRWQWRQELTLSGAEVRLRYELRQIAAPRAAIIGGGYRLQVTVPRDEVLGPRRPENVAEPGLPVEVITADGATVITPFGGQPNFIARPRVVTLPFAGKRVRWRLSESVERVEFWNAGWAQRMNLMLRPGETVEAEAVVDLGELEVGQVPVRVEEVPPRPRPWLTAEIPAREPPGEVLRLVQNLPTIIAYDKPPKHVPTEEKDRLVGELSKHFEVVELFIAWSNWWYAQWQEDPRKREHAENIARETQEWIDAAHRCGMRVALSLSWASPGCSEWETTLVPQFQGETFDPQTGSFPKAPKAFDWANPEAVEFAYRAWRDVASLLRDVDFLFFNEPTWRLQPWHQVAVFSQSALQSWREFTGRGDARLPAKPWCSPTDRTDNNAGIKDWRLWEDWMATLYARMIQTQARAVAAANHANPRYRGAIWFQNKNWVGPKWACDLEKVCAIPEIAYIICEYCTNPREEIWRQFCYAAARHGKRLGSFVNFGYYDAQAPGRVRYEGPDEAFAAAARMGIEQKVDMIAAYPADSVLPWSEAFHAARTRLWDEVTGPYARQDR